jgi:hypothetical protein
MTTPRRSSEPLAAQMRQQALVLRRGFGVAPQLGRAQHLALIVEQHQAVLLAGDADAEDRLAVHTGLLQGARVARVKASSHWCPARGGHWRR